MLFLLILLIKPDRYATKKIVKTLKDFFRKIKFLTENKINYDVTSGVILSTVKGPRVGARVPSIHGLACI